MDTKLVYTAESRALAMLEASMHIDLSEDLPADRNYVSIEIPKDILILEVRLEDLPDDWDSKPPSLTTQIIGDDFVHECEAAILKVPSSIVPQEFNFLINPLHLDIKKITVKNTIPMNFDTRMKSKG